VTRQPTRRLLLLVAAAIGTIGLAIAPPAVADTPPSVWDLAKDPAARDRWEVHGRVTQILFRARGQRPGPMRELLVEQARTVLDAAGAEHSPDVRLRFDLGTTYELLSRHQRAIDVLQPAVDAAPDDPGTSDALLELAYAYAKIDQPKGEREAYKRYLSRATTDGVRATATLNLAEAEMRMGNLSDAIAGYREAIDVSTRISGQGGSLSVVLGYWGLAVALDRAGDPASAAKETKLANQLDPGQARIGDTLSGDVFFEPRHERYWYTALGAQEEARAATDPRVALRLWRAAVDRWGGYVDGAERYDPQDRWLPLAKAHLAAAKKQLAAAGKRVGTLPRTPPPRDVIIDD
jgi:tetratricopeptide (TPR) repeat protein